MKLLGASFLTVVYKAGWNEKHTALMDDAHLWLLHTEGQTCVVIVVSFIESN